MIDSSENTDRYFRDKLENYRESPPQDTWDKIADQLGHRQKRKMVLFISRIAAGVTILISLSILFYYTQKNKRGELALQADTIKIIKTEHPDKGTVRNIDKQTDLTGYDISESGIAGKTARDRSVISGRRAGQTIEQNGQSGSSSEDEILRNNITVEHMASTSNSLYEKVRYLTPIACNNLKTDNSKFNRGLTAFNHRKANQMNATATDQLLAYTEEESANKKQHAEWILGGQFAPLYSYRDLRSDNYQDYVKEQINSKENGVVAYAGGINLTVAPNKRLSIQSGFYYSKYGQEKNNLENITYIYTNSNDYTDNIEWTEPVSEEQIQAVYVGNSTGKIMTTNEGLFDNNKSPASYMLTDQATANQINSSLPVRSVTQYFEYLELPVNLKYKILDKKFDVSLMGGISTNFLIGTDIQLKYTDNSTRNTDYTTEGLNRINYSGLMGIGFEYPLFKNLVLNVEPKFKYYLNAIDKEQVYDIHPYSIGIFSGISYIF